MTFAPGDFLDFSETDHAALFTGVEDVWDAIPRIKIYLAEALKPITDRIRGEVDAQAVIGSEVYVEEGATVEANAVIKGPAWIGSGTTVRSGAYLRENVIVGKNATLGNASEFKNCILFNDCEVPHFNYVGDSILGFKAHLGAGVICSNVRLDRRQVKLRLEGGTQIDTGLRKFGAVIGDRTEIGCNAVLSPGTILGRECLIYPLTSWSGILGDRKIARHQGEIHIADRH